MNVVISWSNKRNRLSGITLIYYNYIIATIHGNVLEWEKLVNLKTRKPLLIINLDVIHAVDLSVFYPTTGSK